MTVVIATVVIVTVVIVTVVIVTVVIATLVRVTIVMVNIFTKNNLNILTTEENYEGQHFAVETIQGRKLFKCGNYMGKYSILILKQKSVLVF